MFSGSAAQSKDNLAPRVEPEVVEARYREEEHDEDEAIVNDDML